MLSVSFWGKDMTDFEIQARMFAALSATNEAILKARSAEELYERVCEAAVAGGRFRSAAALFPDENDELKPVAFVGPRSIAPADFRISIRPDSPFGQGMNACAFRDGKAKIANSFQTDERSAAWRKVHPLQEIGSAASVPLLRNGRSVGVFLFMLNEANAITNEVIGLLERMAANVSFALDVFERDQQRAKAERANRRLTDMFAALSATNTAILRASDRKEMFQLVCDAVAGAGQSLGAAAIFIKKRGDHLLRLVAAAGQGIDRLQKMQISVDPEHPGGRGLAGPAIREQALKIAYDLAADERTRHHFVVGRQHQYGAAAVPLVLRGESIGIIYFFFTRTSGSNDEGILQLMRDIGANISFALEAFEKEAHKERVARMLSAMSAINEAIMRAKSREELYDMVCEAAARGAKFTSTAILLAAPTDEFFTLAACSGPNAPTARSYRYATSDRIAEGRGLSGTAYRTGRPCIQNDMPKSVSAKIWKHSGPKSASPRSGAAMPLFSQGRVAGVLLFMAAEYNVFTPEFTEILERMAENLSFALNKFDQADEKERAEQRVHFLANHDSLTGLPNRDHFNRLLEQKIKACAATQRKCAVLFIDLDRFKVINDSLGHAAGDKFLIEMAGRLRACARGSDIVARLGGDEFVVLLDEVADRAETTTVAKRILAAIAPATMLAGYECRATASIGVAIYPDNGTDAETLTKNADMAMYAVKGDGKNDVRFFSSEVRSQSVERLSLEGHLRHALDLGQFSLAYQPKLDATTRRFTGVEALLRWSHPELGSVPPLTFIPLAEETGLIVPIGRYVLRAACEQNVQWMREGLPELSMAVNLSPRQFLDPDLLRDIDEVLAATGIPARLLQLEVTESMVMQNVDRGIRVLDAIQSRGVRLAIDDFGTGYSSMSLMKQFPIDTIKIDRSFVRELEVNDEDRAIANAIICMGKALGLTVVAEGVETEGQDEFLSRSLCDELQGYLFSKPVPGHAIHSLFIDRVDAPPLQPEPGVDAALNKAVSG
jgi:diguanylate cyclase (GGDEF)-like protein